MTKKVKVVPFAAVQVFEIERVEVWLALVLWWQKKVVFERDGLASDYECFFLHYLRTLRNRQPLH